MKIIQLLPLFLVLLLAAVAEGLTFSRQRRGNYSFKMAATPVEEFFESWNKRDMDRAVQFFADNCVYEDSSFSNKFYGRTEVKKHLIKNAEAFPENTIIKIDKVSSGGENGNIGVQWHIEMNGIELPSSRDCSMYTLDENGLIKEGIDVLEAIPKVGGIALKVSQLFKTAGKFASFYIPKSK